MAKQKLTLKQRRFIKEYTETGNATDAALKVYNVKNYNTAKSIGQENLTKPDIVEGIKDLMERMGISDERLLEKLDAGLEAKKVSEYKGKVKETSTPDLQLQHKYLDTALKLKDQYPAKKIEAKNMNIDVQLEQMSEEEFLELLKQTIEEKGYEVTLKKIED